MKKITTPGSAYAKEMIPDYFVRPQKKAPQIETI